MNAISTREPASRVVQGKKRHTTDGGVCLTRCRYRPSHLWPFLCLVETTHDHLALGALADMFRRVLEVVGEEGETCRAFDGVHYGLA